MNMEQAAAAGLAASSVMTAAGLIAGSSTVTTLGIAGMIAAGGSMAAIPAFKKEDAEKLRRLFGTDSKVEAAVINAAEKLGKLVKEKLSPKELNSLSNKSEDEVALALKEKDENLGKLAETIIQLRETLKTLERVENQDAPKAASGAKA